MNASFLRRLCFGEAHADHHTVSHGFNDKTHNTCCMLSKDTRRRTMESANPIAQASEALVGPGRSDDKFIPWSTCTGSGVCGYHTEEDIKNNADNVTFVKFATNAKKDLIYAPPTVMKLTQACEMYLQAEIFGQYIHRTPDIPNVKGECSEDDKKNIIKHIYKINPYE